MKAILEHMLGFREETRIEGACYCFECVYGRMNGKQGLILHDPQEQAVEEPRPALTK